MSRKCSGNVSCLLESLIVLRRRRKVLVMCVLKLVVGSCSSLCVSVLCID